MVKFMRYDRIGRAQDGICTLQHDALKRGARSNGIAHGVGSERSIDKRTPPLPSDGVWWCDINGLTRVAHPRRGAENLRCEVRSDRFAIVRSYVREPAVTATVPGKAVGLRTKRLPHHRMMSGNMCDGCKLVRRSYYGLYSPDSHIRSLECSRQGVEM
jgi:hypothetical protein